MAVSGFSFALDHKWSFNILRMWLCSLVASWWQQCRESLNLENKNFYLVSIVAQMDCVKWGCGITASICAMEMNGMPWLIWYALNQTVPSLWEWLLIKRARTQWMHATVASGPTYIFIAPLPNLIKMGDKRCRQSARHRRALLPFLMLVHEAFHLTLEHM